MRSSSACLSGMGLSSVQTYNKIFYFNGSAPLTNILDLLLSSLVAGSDRLPPIPTPCQETPFCVKLQISPTSTWAIFIYGIIAEER